MNLTSPKEIRALFERHGFDFSKTLGQNFLISAHIPQKIAEASVCAETTVLEIGPGIGCLTGELATRAKRVIAVEIDGRLLPLLEETLSDFHNVTVIHNDILKVDLRKICDENGKISVCANLPYYISTPILMKLLEAHLPIETITVMVQKEVAQRICAAPGTKEYGALSVAVAYYSEPKILFSVPPTCFMPAPKVESAVVQLHMRPLACTPTEEEALFRVIHAGFSVRRKTFVNALASIGIDKAHAADVLVTLGFSPTVRAETLSVSDFRRVAAMLFAPDAKPCAESKNTLD